MRPILQMGYPIDTDWTLYWSEFGRHAELYKGRVECLGETNEQVKGDVLLAALNGANVIAMAVNAFGQTLLGATRDRHSVA